VPEQLLKVVDGAAVTPTMDTTARASAVVRASAVLLVLLLTAVGTTSAGATGPTDPAAAPSEPSPATSSTGFRDVAADTVHARAIAAMAAAGVTTGCAPDRFCPSAPLTRAQMATLLARGFDLPAASGSHFRDVSADSTHAAGINALAEAGIARGCSEGRFCPKDTLTRAQAATLLATAFGLQPNGSSTFGDLAGNVHDASILALADAGLTNGCGTGRFCGHRELTRAQFASFLYRATSEGTIELSSLRRAPKKPAPTPAPAPGDGGSEAPSIPPSDGVVSTMTRTSVGSPTPTGALLESNGVYTLYGAGYDIFYTRDSFEYAHRSVDGDASLVVRVRSQSPTDPWAKAGLMFRSDLSEGAKHVSIFQTPANGIALQYRAATGGTSRHIAGPTRGAPTWLRLDRVGDSYRGYVSDDGVNWKLVGTVTVSVGALALAGLAVTSHSDGTVSKAEFSDYRLGPAPVEQSTSPTQPDPEPVAPVSPSPSPVPDGQRLLYSATDIALYQSRMSRPGPYHATGDAGHGGAYSPNDGQRSVQLAREFLANPRASYWVQSELPFSTNDPWPQGMTYARPMHAAWVYMTQPDHPDRVALRREVKALLLHQATHPNNDFSNSTNWPLNFPGFGASPIFHHAHWMTRMIKARDMLGRDSFTAQENAVLDRWFYDYANWTANWFHRESAGKWLPGRLTRDYSKVGFARDASRRSYDGGPLIGSAGMAYNNRNAAVMSTMSLAANYLKHVGYVAPTSGGPSYGRFTVDQLVLHSRLFVEETIRFSVWPQGVQGDFERGDRRHHPSATAQLGWLYSANTLANLVEIAEYHAKRGDMSVWDYGTTEGYDGSAGVPVAGGFARKSLHFYAWSMARYVNNGWGRTNDGEPLVRPNLYHDVIPLATAHRMAPNDGLLAAAWRRQGSGMPSYPQSALSQGPWPAHHGEGAKMIGLIEHAGASSLRGG
jgi:regulation of enolase protein 1 (concanavalin A-like superfamily)